jgi:hypothetical protein
MSENYLLIDAPVNKILLRTSHIYSLYQKLLIIDYQPSIVFFGIT